MTIRYQGHFILSFPRAKVVVKRVSTTESKTAAWKMGAAKIRKCWGQKGAIREADHGKD
jgi:hypothetical protein